MARNVDPCETPLPSPTPEFSGTASPDDEERARAFFVAWGLVSHPSPGGVASSSLQRDAMAALAEAFASERSRLAPACSDCLCAPPTHALWCAIGRRVALAGACERPCPPGGVYPGVVPRLEWSSVCALPRGHRGPCGAVGQ